MTDTTNGHLGDNSKAQLKSYIERIERLEEEKKTLADDIRDVYAESKDAGFDTKALRVIIKRRKTDPDKLRAHEETVEAYLHALGMLADTPLGKAALNRATARSRRHVHESMEDAAAVAQEAADTGLISQSAADETKETAANVSRKFG